MHASILISVVLTALLSCASAQNVTTGALGNATVVVNNPPHTYVAALPDKSFFRPNDTRGNIKGYISGTGNRNGVGVTFQVSFSNFPTSGGPFIYHIHDQPVPSDGNCTKTLAHLDPFVRGEATPCDPKLPETCQVGDLSGKYGSITNDSLTTTYSDDFASTRSGLGSYFGNRSITIHFGNKTRITCANFTLAGKPNRDNDTTPTSILPSEFTGLGVKNVASVGTVVGVAALAWLL